MRILIAACVPRRREGGFGGVLSSYAEEFAKLRHEVSTVFAEDLQVSPSSPARFFEINWAARLSSYIWRRREDFDIVNLHAPCGVLYGLRRRYGGARAKMPAYVVSLQGLEENRKYAMKRERKKGRAWNFSHRNRLWHAMYHQPRFDLAVRTADGAHCYSRDVWTVLRLKYDRDDERVAYIPNGVAERFFVGRDYRANRPLRLLMPGTWLDQRGIFYLRDALPGIFRRRPELRFTFAGPGIAPGEIEQFFGPESARNIDILPTAAWEDMPRLYAEHDIFVFPSLMEGQPLVLLEAMASGMAVITTETCGMPDVIEDGRTGLLIPPANAAAIEEGILSLASSAELRERLGGAAQESMRGRTWASSAKRLVAFFERILELERRKASVKLRMDWRNASRGQGM